MSERPDVISEVLEVSGLRTLYFGRFEVGAPWALEVPAKSTSSFYVVLEGRVSVTLEGRDVVLETGDLVLLPHGGAHRIDDGSARGHRMAPVTRVSRGGTLEITGGAGVRATFVSGCFRFAAGATHPLLRALPDVVLFRAEHAGPVLEAIVRLVALESREPGPGSRIILARMTDCLLVHAFRSHAEDEGDTLRALGDRHVAAAVERMHAAPAEAWTVARLAAVAGLSRSVLAARFQERLGESPLRYLARWRMMRAARTLADTSESVDHIAEQLGYESSPAFQKAFKRWQGVGPGAYRRAARRPSPLAIP